MKWYFLIIMVIILTGCETQNKIFLGGNTYGSGINQSYALWTDSNTLSTGDIVKNGNFTQVNNGLIVDGTLLIVNKTYTSGDFTPAVNATFNLGNESHFWKRLYVDYQDGVYSTYSTGASAQIMYISTGNAGATNGVANVNIFGNTLNGVQLGSSTGGLMISNVGAKFATLVVNNTQVITILNNSNVGIRTATPAYQLDVNGIAFLSTGILGSTYTDTIRSRNVDRSHLIITNNVGTKTFFRLNYTNGNIIIGNNVSTDSPDALTIVGNVNITGNLSVKVPYGSFTDNTTQVIGSTSTAKNVNFSVTEESYLITKNANNQNFTIVQKGVYLIDISAIFDVSVANRHVEIWIEKNGVNVARSNTVLHIPSATAETILSVPYIVNFNANDQLRIKMASSDDANARLVYTTSTGYSPASPSIIMTITRISEQQ